MPVATVGVDRGDNAGALAVQMLALVDTDLARQYDAWRAMKTAKVISDDESLRGE
jgi:5-(carboxyamino)imidazole ribonucleotide mutase